MEMKESIKYNIVFKLDQKIIAEDIIPFASRIDLDIVAEIVTRRLLSRIKMDIEEKVITTHQYINKSCPEELKNERK